MMMKQRLLYIERKPGPEDSGAAWIAQAALSKSGRTVYFNGRALKRLEGRAVDASHRCLETGEPYWVAAVQKDGQDRHWVASDPIRIDARLVDEYLAMREMDALDPAQHRAVTDIVDTDASRFHELEHKAAENKAGPTDAATRRRRRSQAP